jgi:hypothetical protein
MMVVELAILRRTKIRWLSPQSTFIKGKLLRVPAEQSAAAAALHFGYTIYGGKGI